MRVPVLSRKIFLTRANFSIIASFLTNIPRSLSFPIPIIIVSGTISPSAQGQVIIIIAMTFSKARSTGLIVAKIKIEIAIERNKKIFAHNKALFA